MDPAGISVAQADCTSEHLRRLFGLLPGRVQNLAKSGGAIRYHLSSCNYATVLQNVNPGVRAAPRTPETGVAVLMFGTNDAIQGSGSGWVEDSFRAGMRTAIARYLAGSVYDHTDISITQSAGSWAAVVFATANEQPSGSGTGYLSSTTVNDELTIAVPSTFEGGTIDIGFIGGYKGGTARITVDGTIHGTILTSNLASSTNTTHRCGTIYSIPNLASGAHTILVKTTQVDASGGYVAFDYWQIRAREYPVVLVCGMAQPSAPGWVWAGITQAQTDTYNRWMRELVAEFADPAVRFVDVDPLLLADSKFFASDGLHPNRWGAAVIAGAIEREFHRAFVDGVAHHRAAFRWTGESDPAEGFQFFRDNGEPTQVVDDFNRSDSPTSLRDNGWTIYAGEWGVKDGQAYVSRDRWSYRTAEDLFNRADAATLGAGWTAVNGTWGIASSAANKQGNGAGDHQIAIQDQGAADHFVEFKVGVRESLMGLVFRYTDANNFLIVVANAAAGGWNLYKMVAGVFSASLAHLSDILSGAGNGIHVEAKGTTVRFFQLATGAESATSYTITDAALETGTKVGLYADDSVTSAARWDDFARGPATTTPTAGHNLAARDTGWSDGAVSFVVGQRANFWGLAFRVQDGRNFQYLAVSTTFGNWALFTVVNGVNTNSRTIKGANAVGTNVEVRMSGDQLTFFFDGVASTSNPITDSTYQTETEHGLATLFGSTLDSEGDYCTSDDFQAGRIVLDDAVAGDLYYDQQTGAIYGPLVGTNWGSYTAIETQRELYQNHGNTGATETINMANGNVHRCVLDANCTFTFSGAVSGKATTMTLLVVQDGTGGRTATWPGSVMWPAAVAPTLTAAANAVDMLRFLTVDGGTTWYGWTVALDLR
jgi:hypothetical protein